MVCQPVTEPARRDRRYRIVLWRVAGRDRQEPALRRTLAVGNDGAGQMVNILMPQMGDGADETGTVAVVDTAINPARFECRQQPSHLTRRRRQDRLNVRTDWPEVGPAQGGPAQGGPAQGGPAQGGPAQGGPAQVGPAQGGVAQVGPAQGGPAQGGPAQVGVAQVGVAQGGPAQVGPAQGGPAQGGPAQVGPAQVGVAQ